MDRRIPSTFAERSRPAVARTIAASLLACAVGCRTTTTEISAASPSAPVVTRFTAARAWELWDRGKCTGHVVWHELAGAPERGFFNVSNPEHQVLGMIDAHNRAWRYHPHQREPEWVGTGTVLEGSRLILGASAESELIRVAIDEKVPAAPERAEHRAPRR